MKNFVTALILISAFVSASIESRAITININVDNNFFDPSFVTANVGDVIKWQHVDGTHTTTSDTVPAGADTWDAPITDNSTTFSYTITVVGHYHYFCTIHGQMMSGVIEAIDATGIPLINTGTESNVLINNANSNSVSLHYQLEKAQQTNVSLYNLAGNKTMQLVDQVLPAGDYSEEYQLSGNITPGVYFIIIESGTLRFTRKVVLQ